MEKKEISGISIEHVNDRIKSLKKLIEEKQQQIKQSKNDNLNSIQLPSQDSKHNYCSYFGLIVLLCILLLITFVFVYIVEKTFIQNKLG